MKYKMWNDGVVAEKTLSRSITVRLRKLPFRLARYFDLSKSHENVPTKTLLIAHAVNERIIGALAWMTDAAANKVKRPAANLAPQRGQSFRNRGRFEDLSDFGMSSMPSSIGSQVGATSPLGRAFRCS